MEKPFVYIASLRRTGSTVLSEALTSPPKRFIFREPKLAINRFTVKKSDIELLSEYGIDLKPFVNRWAKKNSFMRRMVKRGKLLAEFNEQIVPQLLSKFSQIGVKEIYHKNWQEYYSNFPGMKIILTSRDPRDIYISVYYRAKKGKSTFKFGFSPKELARDLNREFKYQLQMFNSSTCLKVRYEDFCTDSKVLDRALLFIGDESHEIGEIGAFNAHAPTRKDEYELHGSEISEIRVNRWQGEDDQEIVTNAHKLFKLMPEYNEFWGYGDN